ncbi:terminus macrodomain insulation protein YfbV [Vibrio mediterranei]
MSERVSLTQSIKNGQKYMELWPMRKELTPLFPEQRIIKATKFGIKVMPAVAAISVLTQMAFSNVQAMPQSIVIALFAISLPVQGMWWLGNRYNTQLPPALASWYRELHQKIIETGCAMEPVKAKPKYKELAVTLNRAFRQLDRSDFDRWF